MGKPDLINKPIKLDTILLRKIRACIYGSIYSIKEVSTGTFHVFVKRTKNASNKHKVIFKYIIEVKPDERN